MWESLTSPCLHFCFLEGMLIIAFTEPTLGRPGAPLLASPRLASVMSPMAPLLLLMPTRSFCSETHQSLCRLIGSERRESGAVCAPPPQSGTTLNSLVLHLTKGPPTSSGRVGGVLGRGVAGWGRTQNGWVPPSPAPSLWSVSGAATRSQVEVCVPSITAEATTGE